MQVRGMVRHKVENHFHAPRVCLAQKLFQVFHISEIVVHIVIVDRIVAVHVVVGGRPLTCAVEYRRKPDRIAAHFVLDVIELGGNPPEISDTVAVVIAKRLYPNVIKGRITLPALFKTLRLIHEIRLLDQRIHRAAIPLASGPLEKAGGSGSDRATGAISGADSYQPPH